MARRASIKWNRHCPEVAIELSFVMKQEPRHASLDRVDVRMQRLHDGNDLVPRVLEELDVGPAAVEPGVLERASPMSRPATNA